MLSLLQICALLLGVLLQLSLSQETERERVAWSEAAAAHDLARGGDAEAPRDSSERSSFDDAADESALASAVLIAAWSSNLGVQPWLDGLARGRRGTSAPFKPPRGLT
jgi:hypothetical protein